MRVLSKQAEAKLLGAIEQAAEYANSGMSPNEAIIKSASEANVPAGHVNLMVHAYNTGRTTKQREAGDNALEKAADFQLADAAVVLQALYPDTVKTSAEIVRSQVVSPEYAISPQGMLARRQDLMRKAAAAATALPEKTYIPPPRDDHAAARRVQSEKMAAQRVREETRREATVAYQYAADAMDKLAEYFRRPGNMSFGDAQREVHLRLGDDGVTVLDKVATVYPQFLKQAATLQNHFGDDAVYGLVDDVLEAVHRYNELKPIEEKTAEKKNNELPAVVTGSILDAVTPPPLSLKQAYEPTGAGRWAYDDASTGSSAALADMFPPPAPTPDTEKKDNNSWLDDYRKQWRETTPKNNSNGLIDHIGGAMGKQFGGIPGAIAKDMVKDPADIRKKQYDKLTAPDHETALKNIKAQATLHDLLLNDNVISGYDPADVANAFNEISNVAPGIVDSPAVMQALLRKRLEAGQLADFDVKQLLEMDKIKTERDHKRLETSKLEREMV
jgi:hypothetical protein